MRKMKVFNANRWRETGDIGDNSQFWQIATILREYENDSGERLADVKWPDGSTSTGHFVNMMRPV